MLLFSSAIACLTLAAALPGSTAHASNAGLDAQQIEADWLNPESLRQATGIGPVPAGVTPEQDAAGGCDGQRDGQWGFHTAKEDNPWWQVDLGAVLPLERAMIFNRCDAAERAANIRVLLSPDGKSFTEAYRHNGTVFYGYSDGLPLIVSLNGATARYVRLQLPGRAYLHLDEVKIYASGVAGNIAYNKPATQSSISFRSVNHARFDGKAVLSPAAGVVQRGLKLADQLQRNGVDVQADRRALEQLSNHVSQSTTDLTHDNPQKLYLEARWAVRRLAFRNPLLDFDSILFAQSAPGLFPHQSDQFYGWWSRPGGGIFVLENFKGPAPKTRCLTPDMPPGSYLRPALSYDAKRVLFAYCQHYPHVADLKNKAAKENLPENAFYHLYEMNVDGSERRQLTRGRYDDFDARYLPNGDIVFLSTRKGTFLQCTLSNTAATTLTDLPDSYVRCGGDNYRPVPVFTLHVTDPQGRRIRPLSAFENFEWTPEVANDGRILYTRWDYIDRFNGPFFSLWSTNPDGSNPQLVYGNYTVRPQVVSEAVPIPNSRKLVFVAAAHHSILGGSLVLLDRQMGTEESTPITRLTPEVPFPETERWVESFYANPWPLSEEHYLVAWSNRKLPPHCRVDDAATNPVNATGLYLYDAFGNLTLLYRNPDISSGNPIPIRPRAKPLAYPGEIAWNKQPTGAFLLQDIYQGLSGVPKGSITSLRIIGVPPKPQPHMNQPNLGVSSEDPGKVLLGTVPVEADGSAYFRVPSGMSVFFQALDKEGFAFQTMRSLTYVWPGQTLSCIGCHEARDTAPATAPGLPIAARRQPSALTLGPEGSWPLRFDQLVQPALDKTCVSCHRPDSADPQAARYDLTPSKAYDNLLAFSQNDLRKLTFERDRSIAGECPARHSKLMALLADPKRHAGVRVEPGVLSRLALWIDLYAQRQGHFSPAQEQALRQLREDLAPIVAGPVEPQ